MALLTCAALVAALASAAPGAVLTLKPGSDCPRMEIANRAWDKQVTVVAEGATVNSIGITKVSGLTWRGGTVTRPDGFGARGANMNGVHVRHSSNLQFLDMAITRAGRGISIGRSHDVLLQGLTISDVRSDCIMIAAARNVVVRKNSCEGVQPKPRRCTMPLAAGAMADAEPEVVLGLKRKVCEEQGGRWADGDHPDAVQIFASREGFPLDNILVEDNRAVGHVQCYGMFMSPGDVGSRVVIRNNYCETSARHAVFISYCTDCEATGNVGRRYGNTPNKVMMRANNSTGRFCGNDNVDGRRDNPMFRPCPK